MFETIIALAVVVAAATAIVQKFLGAHNEGRVIYLSTGCMFYYMILRYRGDEDF